MKRNLICLALLLGLLLTACGSSDRPAAAEDGAPWDENWTMLGKVMGVEGPDESFTLLEYDTALARRDIYFASWKTGEGADYINEEGTEVLLFPAKLNILVYGCDDAAAARAEAADWLERETGVFDIRERLEETHNGQDYTVIRYDCGSETNPYARGASAFGVWNRYALAVELTCTAQYGGNEAALLEEVLDGCHFSAEKPK